MNNIDFSILASQDADFAKILKPNNQLDFSNPKAVIQLTKSLLKQHFNLKIELPPDRLCPPVPNRLNYIKWNQELLDTTSSSYSDAYEPDREVIGLDIGTGASCIYPLLGCAERAGWKFIGTDIDDESFDYAQRNVLSNNLNSRIRLLKTTNEDPLIPLDILGIESIDFTICNPPFYTSTTSLLDSCSQKSRPPFTACTGSVSEMIYPGGEVAFLTRMIHESLELKERVQWYTSMLGKLESLKEVLVILKANKITNFAVKELIQGTKTRRWVVAWSHIPFLPSLSVSRGIKIKTSSSSPSALQKQNLPFPTEFSIRIHHKTQSEIASKLSTVFTALPVSLNHFQPYPSSSSSTSSSVSSSKPASTILISTPSNVWSRASRRQARYRNHDQAQNQDQDQNSKPLLPNPSESEMAFVFKISVMDGSRSEASDPDGEERREGTGGNDGNGEEGGKESGVEVLVRWMKGTDSVVFESFCGMIKRKLEEA